MAEALKSGRSAPKARDISRRMILDRTARLLVEKGYGATSLRDIAEACERKAGSLYYHFESKDALVETVLTEGVVMVDARVREALAGAGAASAMERIKIAMEVHLEALHDKSDYGSAHIRCFVHVPKDIRRRLRGVRSDYEAVWTELFQAARAAGELDPAVDLETLKFAIFGMMNWTLEWRLPPGVGVAEMADRFYQIAFEGAGRG